MTVAVTTVIETGTMRVRSVNTGDGNLYITETRAGVEGPWEKMSTAMPEGQTGATGVTGATGPAGATGATGPAAT